MQGLDWASVLALAVSLLGLLSSMVGGFISARARGRSWKSAAATRPAAEESKDKLHGVPEGYGGDPFDHLDEYWGAESAPSEQAIIFRVRDIEREANILLDNVFGPTDRVRRTFEIRTALHELKVWSDEDVATFDRAMDVRNSVVHGSDRRAGAEPTQAELQALRQNISAAIDRRARRS